MLPDLRGLWNGPWPYPSHAGVGLELTGYPGDIEEFIFFLAQYGCHPKASDRILAKLFKEQRIQLTVQASLEFHAIKVGLEKLGVHLNIIPPQEDWRQTHIDGPWPADLLKRVLEHRAKVQDSEDS